MSFANVLFALLAAFGIVAITVVASFVFWSRGSSNPFRRALALACSFMAGAVLGCAIASFVGGLFLFSGTAPVRSSTAALAFLGGVFGTGLVGGAIAAWIVDRFVVECLWWGGAATRRAP